MSHCIYRVQTFEIVAPFTLRIIFDDGSEQTINFKPILVGKLYGQLSDLSFFFYVQIDPEVHTLVWPNGVDFDPATLHDWTQHEDELVERARRWELSTA